MKMGMSYIIKKTFSDAYLELAKEKSLKKISVMDLTKHCGLSRSTFYNHFDEKFDLLIWTYTSHFENPIEEFRNYDKWIIKTVHFVTENEYFFTQAYKTTDFLDWQKSWIYRNICKLIVIDYGEEELTDVLKYQIQSYVYGAFAIFEDKLEKNEVNFSDNILIDLQNMPNSLRKYLSKR